ncbi:MAG: hypothetical protein HY791_24950 [Deltaproteobacteria bacterium]|nr:hypothetical protein [Deltaproteobacteria bacterium]
MTVVVIWAEEASACPLESGAPKAPGEAPDLATPHPADEAKDDTSGTRVQVGPRVGVSINSDQWIFGGHILFEGLCFEGVGLEPILLVGFGGNHAVLRPGFRAGYTLWLGPVGLMPMAGASLNVAVPVGGFSDFCDEFALTGCADTFIGFELGGGVRYEWLRLEFMAALEPEMPVLTTTLAVDWLL